MENVIFEAKNLYDAKDYKSALPLYKQLYEDDPNDKWVAWFYARCLKECGQIDFALEIAESSHESNPEFEINNKLLAYLLNDKYFKNISTIQNKGDALKLLEKAEFLTIKHEDKSPLEFCVFQTLRAARKVLLNNQNERLLKLLNILDVNRLSQANYKKEIRGKTTEFQSHQEEYFAYKTRILFDLKLYDDCLDCCDLAFEKIEKFHHDNNLWIEERKARCLANMGSPQDAIEKCKNILLKKDSWFIKSSLAHLYKQIGDLDSCKFYMCCAAISRDPLEMKVNLLVDLGDLFTDNTHIAQQHYQMVKKIREEKGWSIPFSLQAKISDQTINPDIKQLKKIWMDFIYMHSHVLEGIVTSFNGNTGFIKAASGSFYFRKNNVYNGIVRIRDYVSFILVDSYDKSKDKVTKEANYILIKLSKVYS